MSTGGLPRGLYAVLDDGARPDLTLAEQARALALAGVRVAQVRCKRARGRAAWTSVQDAVAVLRAAGVLTLVNDRVDWALLSGADGVHVGDEDLPPREARRLLGPDRVLGVTVRGAAGAREAAAAGATYVGLGPVFATRTKEVPAPVLGLERLRAEVQGSPLPVVAIGGIGLENVTAVARTGVHGAAVVSDLWVGGDPAVRGRGAATRLPSGGDWGPHVKPHRTCRVAGLPSGSPRMSRMRAEASAGALRAEVTVCRCGAPGRRAADGAAAGERPGDDRRVPRPDLGPGRDRRRASTCRPRRTGRPRARVWGR